MLHLTNGDASTAALRDAGVAGEIVSIDDILVEGPLPNALAGAADRNARATWLARHLAIPKADALAAGARRERMARTAAERDEVVVWTEDDLFCQTNLAHFLHLLAGAPPANASIACAPPGERVGPQKPEGIQRILESRRPLAPAQIALGSRAWLALASPDPRDVEALARADLSAWPSLALGLRLQLARFPSARNGLGLVEGAILRLLDAPRDFRALFALFHADPATRDLGFGDLSVHQRLVDLARGDAPLVKVDDPRALDAPESGGAWSPTDLGRAVLAGEKDAIRERGIDAWIGGARLEGRGPVWRWDGARLVIA